MRQSWQSHIFLLFASLLVMLPLTLCTLLQKVSSVHAASQTTAYGFHFASQFKTPSKEQLALLRPQWMRYGLVVPYKIPKFSLAIKKLIVFNNESVTMHAPSDSADVAAWQTYVDTGYIPALTKFLHTYPDIAAMEIWNEEDLCAEGSACPSVPAAGYAYMINKAASAIKAFNANISVIMGGLGSGNVNYVRNVKAADASAFEHVDAIGIHPYGASPDGWCASGCVAALPFGDLATSIENYRSAGGLPVWITEVSNETTDKDWQGQYAQRVFSSAARSSVPVVIWYGMQDASNGTWGLLDANGSIKPSGQVFTQFCGSTFS